MGEMADLGFFDGLVLGSVLLGTVFAVVYVGFSLVPAFWIAPLIGLPMILAIVSAYEFLRRSSRTEVMRGVGPRFLKAPSTKYCPACVSPWHVDATDCLACGRRLLPTYHRDIPPARFCLECGASLESASRYRRGWCPRCREYR